MNWAFIKWHKWSDEITEEARHYLQSLLMHIKLLPWYLFVFIFNNSPNLVWEVEKVSFYLLIPRIKLVLLFVLFPWSWPQADDTSKLTSSASFLAGLTITVEIERSLMSCDFSHLVQWTWFSVPDSRVFGRLLKKRVNCWPYSAIECEHHKECLLSAREQGARRSSIYCHACTG